MTAVPTTPIAPTAPAVPTAIVVNEAAPLAGRTLITGASELLTCADAAPDLIGRIPHGEVLIEGGRVVAVGRLGKVTAEHRIEAMGGVVIPGFVDCHTHAVFGDDRVDEYVCACAGQPAPQEAPVGITGTVAATRQLDPEALVQSALPRIHEMQTHGTTTVEIKSGYGLDVRSELAMLEANHALQAATGIGVVSTYLGAHAFPPEGDRATYVDLVCELIPEVAERGLASFCDVYCDDGYFSLVETRRILDVGLKHGLAPKLHLDAYSHTGAAAIAADLSATSVDHLNYTRPEELERLAAANVAAVAVPLLEFAVKHPRPVSPNELLARGLRVALATDCCPGAYVCSMQLVIQYACRERGMRVAQAIRAATIDAALAAGCAERVGSLEPGKQADLLILDTSRHEHLAYRIGYNAVSQVMIAGEVVSKLTNTSEVAA